MDSKEFFKVHEEKIKATAEFLCSKDPSKNINEQFKNLKQQYFNQDGNCHSETINGTVNISSWLETIRHQEIENFIMIAVYNGKPYIIFKITGDQFSSPDIQMVDIDTKIVQLLNSGCARSIGIYVMHNHPFIYKASPSYQDLITCEAISNELDNIVAKAGEMGIKCQIGLIDFGIVTEYDYWSVMQSKK